MRKEGSEEGRKGGKERGKGEEKKGAGQGEDLMLGGIPPTFLQGDVSEATCISLGVLSYHLLLSQETRPAPMLEGKLTV